MFSIWSILLSCIVRLSLSQHTTLVVLSVLDWNSSSSVQLVMGTVTKFEGNPVMNQTWETDINNGYPNVIHNGTHFQLYYNTGCKGISQCSGGATMYAVSPDGNFFNKPSLNRHRLTNGSTSNNVLFVNTSGVGLLYDIDDKNISARYKAWGGLSGIGDNATLELTQNKFPTGVAVSANGLDFTDYTKLKIDGGRCDTHTNVFFDRPSNKYIGTMRAKRPCPTCGQCPIWYQHCLGADHTIGCQKNIGPKCTAIECNQTVRAIGRTESSINSIHEFGPNIEVSRTDSPEHQMYAQVTFPWHNVYLGLVAIFDTTTEREEVHCELNWSPDSIHWQQIQPGIDFIPLGHTGQFDDHIIFPAAFPIPLSLPPSPPICTRWLNVTNSNGTLLNDCDAYRQGLIPYHTICAGTRQNLGTMNLNACREACSIRPTCHSVQWQGLRSNKFRNDLNGSCFLFENDCKIQKPYKNKDFCMVIEICEREFLKKNTQQLSTQDVRIYYMGGNGGHYLPRNSSLGYVTLRSDGYIAVTANNTTGYAVTTPILITGSNFFLTADTAMNGASINVSATVNQSTVASCRPFFGMNVTNTKIDCDDFSKLIDQRLVIKFTLKGPALLYTFAFG